MTRPLEDDNGNQLPVYEVTGNRKISFTGTSARTSTDFDEGVKMVTLTPQAESCYVKFGDDTVTATADDIYLEAGVPQTFRVGSNARLAAIQVSAAGTLHIQEK